MDELVRMVRVNREHAEEQRAKIEGTYGPLSFWSNDDTQDYEYWSGQVDAFDRVLEAWKFLGVKEVL